MKKALFFILVIVCFIIETNAQIIHIPSDFSTIQAGINSAATGDTVLVAEGTHFENINFKGKAITVASQFIMDGNTSHISKTVINGSQSTRPDTASVVTMWSGEDTTSVLMGFTITGGRGTIARDIGYGSANTYISGGGVLINHSGGKIVHNIIEGNHLADPGKITRGAIGCGILASVNHNHTAIIRANIIRNNTSIDGQNWGGGVSLYGGRMLVENNSILNNTFNGVGMTGGAGIFHENEYYEGTIEDVIIRNNLIMGNKANSEINDGFGGGIGVSFGFGSYDKLQIYNNVIAENFAEGSGGGVYSYSDKSRLFNNTIINNEATVFGNSIHIDKKVFMYNNIVWSDSGNTISEIGFGGGDSTLISAYYNMLEEPIKPGGSVTESQNYYMRPIFKPNSYELAENSPGIGWGIDSIQFENAWYYAPSTDLAGNPRPNPIDINIDLGAYESPFKKILIDGVEKTANAGIRIYPNPVQNVLHINLSGKTGELQVFDISGRCWLQKQITENENSVDVSCLERGIYFVRVMHDKQIFTGKIVKY